MRRVIMLLPNPDLLQLANCHKYVTRKDDRAYSDIYTMKTIAGKCADVGKILVIGHGEIGGFVGASPAQVAQAIIQSKISLTGGHTIGFDTCYAGTRDTTNPSCAMHLVRVHLKKHDFDCNLKLTGATGPSITIGDVGDKRLVVDPAKLNQAGRIQGQKMSKHGADLFSHRSDWQESAPSEQIKTWAQEEHSKLIKFARDFRSAVKPHLDTSSGRKVVLQV